MSRNQAGETYTIDATENIVLGHHSGSVANLWVVQIVGNTFTGTVTPQAKVQGAPDADYLAVAYRDATDEAIVTAADGPVTDPTNEIIEINGAGRIVRLAVVVSANDVEITYWPVMG